ncbi:MAG TPA: hypothetical protein VFQ40_07435 [Actinomycetota bacterium]|nr:hypothetical protein [Actinomycetota bacterium]
MPLTAKGRKVMASLVKQHGAKKAESVFYAMANSGKHPGLHAGQKKGKRART